MYKLETKIKTHNKYHIRLIEAEMQTKLMYVNIQLAMYILVFMFYWQLMYLYSSVGTLVDKKDLV